MRPINVVLLDEPVALDMEAVAHAVRTRHPNVPVDIISGEAKGPGSKESPLIRCDNEFVVVMNMPAPAPREPGTDAVWDRASFTWPEAIEARDRHRAHIIVATLAEGKNPLKEARSSRTVTRSAAAKANASRSDTPSHPIFPACRSCGSRPRTHNGSHPPLPEAPLPRPYASGEE